jgi:hypothetical protein
MSPKKAKAENPAVAAIDPTVEGFVRAVRKAERRLDETRRDLQAAVRAAVRENRLTKKDADNIERTFAKE